MVLFKPYILYIMTTQYISECGQEVVVKAIVSDTALMLGAQMAATCLMFKGSFGPCKMKAILNKHEYMDYVGLETDMLKKNGVPPT